MFKNARFEKLLVKATSELLMEADWETNLQICDLIRGQEVTPKYAVTSLKKKFNNENPHVLMLGLSLLESMMKNCGTPMHDEVGGTDFPMDLLEYIHCTDEVRIKIFDLIQNWEYAFKDNLRYRALHEAFKEIKSSGHELPPFIESQAMFAADVAPGWKDGDSCFRCKVSFSTFRRKHHCRNCGNVFCGECTTGRAVIAKFAIEREVRVCEDCINSLSKTPGGPSKNHTGREESRPHPQPKATNDAAEKAARDKQLQLQEEEELQLALALSASEVEAKQQPGNSHVAAYPSSTTPTQPPPALPAQGRTQTPEVSMNDGGVDTLSAITEMDPELARYLNRNYWMNRAAMASDTESIMAFPPSAPPICMPSVNPHYEPSIPDSSNEKPLDFPSMAAAVEMPVEGYSLPGVPPLTSAKQEEFLEALRKSIEVFVNRMRVNSQRGRPVANDPTLQTLFQTLHAMHPQLLQYSSELEHRRAYLEKLQDDSTQLREAREALDALRRDHAEQRRQKEEEANRQRQIQMMQKVEVLRQQKRDAMEAQRRLAMEQTMQYQQQYQYHMQQPYAGIDPTTGMSLGVMPGYGMPPQQPGAYLPGMEYATYGPPGGAYMCGVPPPPAMEQGPPEPNPEESTNANPPYGMQGMMQALPPPKEAPREYIPQPNGGGGYVDLVTDPSTYPMPPSEDPPISTTTTKQEEVKKPPTPTQEQLICFE